MEDPEKSVGFLCHKFTALFSKLKLVEEERNRALDDVRTAELRAETLQDQLRLSERRSGTDRIQFEHEISAWRSKTEAGDSVLANVKADREELEVELQMMRGRLHRLQERDTQSSEQLTDVKEKAVLLDTANTKLESEVSTLNAKLSQLRDDAATMEASSNTLQRENQHFRQLIDTRNEELRLTERRYTEELNASRLQKDELQRTCKALSTQTTRATELTNLSSTMELQIKDLKERLDALRSRNKIVAEEATELQKCTDALQVREGELHQRIMDECGQSDELRAKLLQCEAAKQSVIEDVTGLRSACQTEKVAAEVLQAKVAHWEDKAAHHVRQLEGYREDSKTSQTHLEVIQEQKMQLERVNDSLRTDLGSSFAEKDRLEKEKLELHAEVDHWLKKYHHVVPILNETRGRKCELEQRVADQDEELYGEREAKQKLQREARVSSEKMKALSRKCDQLVTLGSQRSGPKHHFEKMLRNGSRSRYEDWPTSRDMAESSIDLRSLSRKNPTIRTSTSIRPESIGDAAAASPDPVEYLCRFVEKEEARLSVQPTEECPETPS